MSTVTRIPPSAQNASRLTPSRRGERGVVERARAYLDQHWRRNVPLDELAGAVGMSKFHLSRRFAEALGCPPHAYQNRVRVEKACDLLRGGEPVSEAARRVGFSDASHLCRHFKRVMGTTPGRFARESENGGGLSSALR